MSNSIKSISKYLDKAFEEADKEFEETINYIYPLINYAEHHYYKYSSLIRTFDLWIESIVKNCINI